MKFARIVFMIAGIYGLIVFIPMYFLEAKTGRDFPPAITHPEYFYGFIGIGIAWQVLFLFLSTNPIRYRSLMIPSMLEKLAFVIPVSILFLQHRVAFSILVASLIDLSLGVLFVAAYIKTPSVSSNEGRTA